MAKAVREAAWRKYPSKCVIYKYPMGSCTGAAMEAELINNFWKLFIANGARYAPFTGSRIPARSIISTVLDHSTEFLPVPLEIQ